MLEDFDFAVQRAVDFEEYFEGFGRRGVLWDGSRYYAVGVGVAGGVCHDEGFGVDMGPFDGEDGADDFFDGGFG